MQFSKAIALSLAIFTAVTGVSAKVAYQYNSKTLYFNIISSSTCELTNENQDLYTGYIIIPQIVEVDSKTYTVTAIGEWAFNNCKELESVEMPNTVTVIKGSAFASSTVKSIKMSDTLLTIEGHAFRNCTQLQSIALPNTVTSIGSYAFDGCTRLGTITLGNSLKSIGEWAFYNCSALTEIEIPQGVTAINKNTFFRCSKLESAILPKSLTRIEEGAFSGCDKLKAIDLPKTVTYIGANAFFSCKSLTSVEIPQAVTFIGKRAFACCVKLASISGEFTTPDHRCLIFDDELISFAQIGINTYKIPETVTAIGPYAFAYLNNINTLNIPNSVTTIGDFAFNYNLGIIGIKLPNSVTTIGEESFANCDVIKLIEIPESVTSIGDKAFSGCRRLSILNVYNPTPAGIKLGKNVFEYIPTSTCTLCVPIGSEKLYKAAPQWQDFLNIIETDFEEFGITDVIPYDHSTATLRNCYYDLWGRKHTNPSTPGIYLHNGTKILIK